MTLEIKEIKHKKKVIAKGIILGKRKYHWTLKKKYNPCFAILKPGSEYVSELSPHKRDFTVYIPESCLKPGACLFCYSKEYQGKTERLYFKIIERGQNFIEVKELAIN